VCKSHEDGGMRCEVTARTRKMATVRRRLLRTNALLDQDDLPQDRRQELVRRALNARIELGEAKDSKDSKDSKD